MAQQHLIVVLRPRCQHAWHTHVACASVCGTSPLARLWPKGQRDKGQVDSRSSALVAMAVPCELVTEPVPHKVQTYVIKAGPDVEPDVLRTWAQGQAVLGAGAWALAEVRGASPPDTFLVITMGESCFFESRVARIKEGIKQLPTHPTVEWVRPLTRRFQRHFSWGDVCASVADVRQACRRSRHSSKRETP